MKRIICTLLMLAAILAIGPRAGAKVYPIWIGGTQLTSDEGGSKINGSEGGSATYNSKDRILTLDEFNSPETVITIGDESTTSGTEFTIMIKGSGGIKQLLIKKVASVKIEGEGDEFFISNEEGTACEIKSGVLKFNAILCFMGIEGKLGLVGSKDSELLVNSCFIMIGAKQAAISQFKSITFKDCGFMEGPKSFVANHGGLSAVVDANNNLVKGLVIDLIKITVGPRAGSHEDYYSTPAEGISVGGGTLIFDKASRTVTLNNVALDEPLTISVLNEDNVTIKLIGENRLTQLTVPSANSLSIISESGTGSLSLKYFTGMNAAALSWDFLDELIIRNCKLNLEGTYGFGADIDDEDENYPRTKLLMDRATINFKMKEAALTYFSSITFEKCRISSPKGAAVKEYSLTAGKFYTVLDENNDTPAELIIERQIDYPIIIAETQFTNFNTEITCGNGKATYDHATKTLTLENAEIMGDIEVQFKREEDINFTLILIGDNKVIGRLNIQECTATIDGKGSGKLTVNNDYGRAIYFNSSNKTLTIKESVISAKGETAISSTANLFNTLLIENSTVTAEGIGTTPAICDFGEITLTDCKIVEPEGAKIGSYEFEVVTVQGIVDAQDELISGPVKIVATRPVPQPGDNNGNGDNPNAVQSALLAQAVASPNPFGGWLRVDNAANVTRYALYNAIGQPVLAGSHDGSTQLHLETNDLPTGIYLLRLEARDGARAIKVMKR